MKKTLFILLLLATQAAKAEWITLTPSNLDNIQIVEPTITTGAVEGVYVVFKTSFTTASCSTKNIIAILDSKLADRTYSALMLAMATNKTIQFYLDSPAKCTRGMPVATGIMLVP